MQENNPNLQKVTDRELVVLALEGKQEGYTLLLERYRGGLYTFVQEFLSGIQSREPNAEQAEEPQDICQEAFHRAFHNLESYNSNYEFSTWLFNIARNVSIDYLRKQKIHIGKRLSNEHTGELQALESSLRNSPEDKLISAQEYQQLIRMIDNLDEKYREIARMRFIREYAYDEIARETNLQLSTVKTRIKRAKEQLMELIKNK